MMYAAALAFVIYFALPLIQRLLAGLRPAGARRRAVVG